MNRSTEALWRQSTPEWVESNRQRPSLKDRVGERWVPNRPLRAYREQGCGPAPAARML